MAKLHAIHGKMLKSEDYAALVNCVSVADAAEYLKKNTRYSRLLEGIATETIHRGSLENILRRGTYESYFRIIGFEKIGGSEFYNFLIVKTEIDEILVCLAHLNAGSTNHIDTLPIYMNRYTSFDLMELVKVRSFDELLQLVHKTDYYPILKSFAPTDTGDGRINYAGCELALRTYYGKRLLDSLSTFGGSTEKKLKSFIGTQIDMINIINAYRMKTFFHADEKDIKARMIPVHMRIAENVLDDLYSARDEKDFLEKFSRTYYGRELAGQGIDLSNPEAALIRLRYKQTKRAFSSSVSAPECFYTFNILADTELRNIIRVIEGIRYSLSPSEISALLIS